MKYNSIINKKKIVDYETYSYVQLLLLYVKCILGYLTTQVRISHLLVHP